MRTLKKNWTRIASTIAIAIVTVATVYACFSVWGQTAPGLSIKLTNGVASLTVTNGTTNGEYQIYFTEFLDPDNENWTLLTNGAAGQTNFNTYVGDLEQGYFKAVGNSSFAPPSITVIIQSPANGSVVY